MPGDEGLLYNDTAHDTNMISTYTAFLALQAKAYTMSDREYAARLDAIMEAGGVPDSGKHYGENDLQEEDGVSQAVIDAIQSDDPPGTGQTGKRVLQFEQYGGTIEEQLGTDADGGQAPPEDDGEDDTLDIRYESEEENAPTAGGTQLEDADGGGPGPEDEGPEQEDADGTLDISFEDEPAAAQTEDSALQAGDGDGESIEDGADGPEDDDSMPGQSGVYKHAEDSVEPESEPEPEGPGAGGAQPQAGDGQWPGTVGTTVLDDDLEEETVLAGGGVNVTEHFEVNDWLDTLAAGTGLLSGIQTAEYIPPHEVQAQAPATDGGFEKTDLMKQLDRKVEYTFGPEPGERQESVDGPGI